MSVTDDVDARAEAVSELANAMQAVVLLAADLDRQLRHTPWRGDIANLRSGLTRATAATLRLVAELRADR